MKNYITILLIVISCFSYGQTYQTLNNVKIEEGLKLKRKVTVKDCDLTIPANSVIKKETVINTTEGDTQTTNTLITETKYPNATTIKTEKLVELDIESFDGKANIYVDEKDKSIIHVNYWLGSPIILSKDTKIRVIKNKINCDKTVENVSTSSIISLTKKTKYDLWKCPKEDKNKDFVKYSDTIIEVYDKDGNLDYLLVNKYDSKNDYTLSLENRDVISFKNSAIVFGPITIPIKYRFGYNETKGTNKIKVSEEFKTDFNLGIFGGWTIGEQKMRCERGVGVKELASCSSTIGAFIGFSTETLNKSNTTAGDNSIDDDSEETIGVISPGIGIVKNIYNFNIGIYWGWDIGVGRDSNNWNFDGKPWLGIGIGYSLTGFWKK